MTAADVPAPGLTVEEERFVSRPAVDIAADVAEEAVARAVYAADEDPFDAYPVAWENTYDGRREHCRRLARAALAAARPPADADDPAAADVLHADLCELLNALGLGAQARPYSAHEVMQRDVIPMARSLRAAVDLDHGITS